MSDDFDKQDDDFDWLGDDDDNESSSSDSSGLTGELSWLQGDDSPDAQLSDDGTTEEIELDWLQSSGSDAGAPLSDDATGVTGELSWIGTEDIDESPDAKKPIDTDALEWVKSTDDSLDDDDTPIDDTPDWLQDEDVGYDPDAPEEQQSFRMTGLFDNMDSTEDTDDDEAPGWLSNMGETGALEDHDAVEQPDWLSNVGDTGALDRSQIQSQLDALGDDVVDDEQPDWLSGMGLGQPDAETPSADDAPDWLSDMPASDDSEDDSDDFAMPGMDDLFGSDDDSEDDSDDFEMSGMDTLFGSDDDFDSGTDDLAEQPTGKSDTDWLTQYDDDDEYSTSDSTPIIEEPAGKSDTDWMDQYDDDDEYPVETSGDTEELSVSTAADTDHDTGWLNYDDDEDAFPAPVPGDTDDLTIDTTDTDHDTGWLNYAGEDDAEDEEYDPYAQYEDDEEDFEDIFNTGSLVDTGALTEKEDLFSTDHPVSDTPINVDDAPDWLSSFSDEDFDDDDIAVEQPVSDQSDMDWLQDYDSDAFTPEPPADPIDINEVPDWLQGGDSVSDDPVDSVQEQFADAPDFSADDLLDDLGFDELKTPSTGLTGELDSLDFDLDDLGTTGLTGELANLDDLDMDLLDDLDLDDLDLDELELDLDNIGSTGLTGELESSDDRVGTGFTGELGAVDEDMDLSFLDEVEVDDDAPQRVGTGFTGELDNADEDMDLSFLDEVEVDDDAPQRVGTGFTGELDNADEDMDLSFLDEVEVDDDAPQRVGTGFTGELDNAADDDVDLSFLDDDIDFESDDEPDFEPIEEAPDLSFLDGDDDDEPDFEPEEEDLDLSFLDDDDDDEPDWFDEAPQEVEEGEPEWMRTLSEADLVEEDADLDDLFGDDDDLYDSDQIAAPAADLDSLLATFDEVDASDFAEDEDESTASEDLDAIFDAALRPDDPEDDLPNYIPDWLREADISSDESSAAAIIRQQSDKPIEELDDRLQALREKALSATPQAAQESAQSDLKALSGVGDTLASPTIEHEAVGIISDIKLTNAQQAQSQLLQEIVGVTITPTVETDADGVPIVESSRRRSRLSLPKVGVGRLLIAALILLVTIIPFVSRFSVGDLPPLAFGANNRDANAVFNQISTLNSGDWVLVGIEYGPTAAGELDPVADILLRHIFAEGGKPIIVSSNPVAIVHVQNIINDINSSVHASGLGLVPNRDYYIARYLTGGTLGLRDLSQNFGNVVNIDVRGNATNLSFTSLNELALMLVIAEQAEDIRNWAEQIAPSTNTKLIAATGYAAQPLTEPYVNQTDGISGLLVGYREAFTYGEMLQAVFATPTTAPTETFTATATETHTPEATDTPVPTNTLEPTATVDADSDATIVPLDAISDTGSADDQPTDTPVPTNTPVPSNTPTSLPTDTPAPTDTPVPSDTPTSTPSPSPTPRLIDVITINPGNGAVNVRTGPGTNNPFKTTANSGDVFQVIELNEDGTWIHFYLPDGDDGWIATFLVEQSLIPEDDFEGEIFDTSDDSADAGGNDVIVLRYEFNRRLGKNGARSYRQTTTETPVPEFTATPTPDPRAGYAFARNRNQEVSRLNAMTMGTIAAVIIILFGNIYFGLRVVAQRRRESKR